MADDTRQKEDLSRDALTVNPANKPFAGDQWQDAKVTPNHAPENANLMPGGTENTAGGKTKDITLENAFQEGLKWSDFTDLPKRPCVRDSLLTGIGTGAALGSFRTVFGAPVWKACNWAVGSMCLGSIVMYQYCTYRRQAEREGMMRAVEILNQREGERRARELAKEKAKAERRLLKEQEQDQQYAAARQSGRSWWKVW